MCYCSTFVSCSWALTREINWCSFGSWFIHNVAIMSGSLIHYRQTETILTNTNTCTCTQYDCRWWLLTDRLIIWKLGVILGTQYLLQLQLSFALKFGFLFSHLQSLASLYIFRGLAWHLLYTITHAFGFCLIGPFSVW